MVLPNLHFTQMRTMALEYLPVDIPQKWLNLVGKYSSTAVSIWVRILEFPLKSGHLFSRALSRQHVVNNHSWHDAMSCLLDKTYENIASQKRWDKCWLSVILMRG